MRHIVKQRSRCYQGWFTVDAYEVTHDRFNGGTMSVRRELLERGDSVGVLLIDSERDTVLLLEQFRIGPMVRSDRPWLIEIVAGMVDDGESVEEAAYRESLEEAGYAPKTLRPLGAPNWYPSPGACSEQITLFLADVDSSRPQNNQLGVQDEGEDIRRYWVSRSEAMAMVADGRINSALPMLAMLLAFGTSGAAT
ncbi:MAG: NUDIX domain-containing protein [Mariprofundales bacterium]|nr:NUDIX domain-containing protein [Mariprofundales bacterium]